MSKTYLQDLAKVKRVKPERPSLEQRLREQNEIEERPRKIIEPRSGGGKSRNLLWIVAVIAVVFLFFALSYLFGTATVTINPKVNNLALNDNLSASKDGSSDALSFNLVEISGNDSQMIQATTTKNISQKAAGDVIIYNAYSVAPQNLNINTRLVGSNGKIYKTEKALVVPGMSGSTPGSVEVMVAASDVGDSYNSDPLDFKILGFAGTPKDAGFYGRSKGSITGGLQGVFPYVSDSQKMSAEADLKTDLESKLFQNVADQIPAGFILFKNSVFLTTNNSVIDYASAQGNTVPMEISGTLDGILFDESKLTKKIAADTIPSYDGSDVYISNSNDLNFTLTNKDTDAIGNATNINFNLSGNANFVWKFDTDKLVSDLLGQSKKDFSQILLQYPNIDSANSTISPFWKMSFPDKIKNIHVIVNYPK